MHRIAFVFLLCLITAAAPGLQAQRFYVTTGRELVKPSFGNGTCNSAPVVSCTPGSFSITLYKDTLYYNQGSELYRAIRSGNDFIDCQFVANITRWANALTVDKWGQLYYASGNRLFRMNPQTKSEVFLGTMPYMSAGDLVFYNDKLYLASLAGVVEVNTTSPDRSVLAVPFSNRNMFGLAVLAVDCDKNALFAFLSEGQQTAIAEVNITGGTISAPFCTLPHGVDDAASLVESGGFSGIIIDNINIQTKCEKPGKGSVQISCERGLVPFTFTLNNGISNTTGIFEDIDAGNYNLRITTPGGCVKDTFFTVPLLDQPPVRFQVIQTNPTCSTPGRIRFLSEPFSNTYKVHYRGADYPVQQEFSSLSFGEHRFTITNEFGCVLDSANIHFVSQENCDAVYFPSAFTPNNDGKNDVFKGSYNWGLRQFRLQVFNRWGQLVFASTDQQKGWDGTIGNAPQATGVFVWVASYTTIHGVQKTQKGTVLLIR